MWLGIQFAFSVLSRPLSVCCPDRSQFVIPTAPSLSSQPLPVCHSDRSQFVIPTALSLSSRPLPVCHPDRSQFVIPTVVEGSQPAGTRLFGSTKYNPLTLKGFYSYVCWRFIRYWLRFSLVFFGHLNESGRISNPAYTSYLFQKLCRFISPNHNLDLVRGVSVC